MMTILVKLAAPVLGFIMKQPFWKILVGTFLVVSIGAAAWWGSGEHARRVDADNRAAALVILNDSTQARLARMSLEKGQLQALIAAQKDLGGKLVAGVQIVVKPETVFVPVKEVQTVVLDSTRYATLTDSTAGYKIEITGEAPPVPDNLKLGYRITTPEFRPQVGFIRKDDDYYAVVSYAGKKFTTDSAFFIERKEFPFSVWGGIDAVGVPKDSVDKIQPSIYLGLKYKNPGFESMLKAGIGRKLYVGISMEKKFF